MEPIGNHESQHEFAWCSLKEGKALPTLLHHIMAPLLSPSSAWTVDSRSANCKQFQVVGNGVTAALETSSLGPQL